MSGNLPDDYLNTVKNKTKIGHLQTIDELNTAVDVTVTEGKMHGSMVAITIKASSELFHDQMRDTESDILARYPVKYRLEIV